MGSTTPTTSTGHSTPARTASSPRSDCDTRPSPNLLAATKTPIIVTKHPHRYTMSSILITRFTQQFNKPVCRFAFELISFERLLPSRPSETWSQLRRPPKAVVMSDTRNVSHRLPKTRGFGKFFSDEKRCWAIFKIVVTSESSLFKTAFTRERNFSKLAGLVVSANSCDCPNRRPVSALFAKLNSCNFKIVRNLE